jgi:formylglycine-generating enzyme required for sulfatase activity
MDEDQVTVVLTHRFEMQQTEMTQAFWRQYVARAPTYLCDAGTCPVDNVYFTEALAFANALSVAHGLPSCYALGDCTSTLGSGLDCLSIASTAASPYACLGYRLPTEAEWEYAARAGTVTSTYNGNTTPPASDLLRCYDDAVLDPIADYCQNAGGVEQIVARLEPNAWGLYDMLGNVDEWTDAFFTPFGYGPSPLKDPYLTGPRIAGDDGGFRVSRGSRCNEGPGAIRAAGRNLAPIHGVGGGLGFRLVRTLP